MEQGEGQSGQEQSQLQSRINPCLPTHTLLVAGTNKSPTAGRWQDSVVKNELSNLLLQPHWWQCSSRSIALHWFEMLSTGKVTSETKNRAMCHSPNTAREERDEKHCRDRVHAKKWSICSGSSRWPFANSVIADGCRTEGLPKLLTVNPHPQTDASLQLHIVLNEHPSPT